MGSTWVLAARAQLHKDANKALDENLVPGERVVAIICGTWDSAMIATDRRVFVFKKGFFSGSAMAKKLVSWDYRNVTGIQVETGKISGTVVIQAAGAQAVDASYWGSGNNSAMKATNALAIASPNFKQARDGAVAIRQALSAHQNAARAVVPPPAAAPDPMDQLRKLGDLRDAGLLTAEEFAAKKAELLARM